MSTHDGNELTPEEIIQRSDDDLAWHEAKFASKDPHDMAYVRELERKWDEEESKLGVCSFTSGKIEIDDGLFVVFKKYPLFIEPTWFPKNPDNLTELQRVNFYQAVLMVSREIASNINNNQS